MNATSQYTHIVYLGNNPIELVVDVHTLQDIEGLKDKIINAIKAIPSVSAVQEISVEKNAKMASFSGESFDYISRQAIAEATPESVDEKVRTFLLKESTYITTAYKMRDRGNEQCYIMALKEDTEANQDLFLDFMLAHNDTEAGAVFPISFRFVRAEFIKRAGGLEPIIAEQSISENAEKQLVTHS